MAIGARDYIDQLLVKKYSDKQVDNHTVVNSAVPPERVLEILDDYANTQKTMLALKQKLAAKCQGLSNRIAYNGVRSAAW